MERGRVLCAQDRIGYVHGPIWVGKHGAILMGIHRLGMHTGYIDGIGLYNICMGLDRHTELESVWLKWVRCMNSSLNLIAIIYDVEFCTQHAALHATTKCSISNFFLALFNKSNFMVFTIMLLTS